MKAMSMELSLNSIIQVITILTFIVSGTVFVTKIQYRVDKLEDDNKAMHSSIRSFMREEKLRDEKQDASLMRFADKIDKRLDAIEARKTYCEFSKVKEDRPLIVASKH
jgi:hypothetical protein